MTTRKTPSGDTLGIDQKISVHEAFNIYTRYAAYASFEEKIKGSLTPGRLADMVVLSEDPWRIPPEEIAKISVVMTILGGRVVHRET